MFFVRSQAESGVGVTLPAFFNLKKIMAKAKKSTKRKASPAQKRQQTRFKQASVKAKKNPRYKTGQISWAQAMKIELNK